MIKYDLILCHHILAKFIIPITGFDAEEENTSTFRRIIKQHHILLTNVLEDAYFSAFSYDELIQRLFLDFICSENSKHFIHRTEIESADGLSFDDSIIASMKCKEFKRPCIVCGSVECTGNKTLKARLPSDNIVYSSGLLADDITNKVRRMSIPFSDQTIGGEAVGVFATWFSELFSGEREINIFDKFIFEKGNFKAFIKYILNSVEAGTMLRIYTDIGKYNDEVQGKPMDKYIHDLEQRYKIRIDVYNSIEGVHDRHIFTSSFYLRLGRGINFVTGKNGVKDCSIELKKADRTTLKSFAKKYSQWQPRE